MQKIKMLLPIAVSAAFVGQSVTAGDLVAGFDITGYALLKYTIAETGGTSLRGSSNMDLTFGFDLGAGIAGIGVNAIGYLTDGYRDIVPNGYVYYGWNDSKITAGYISPADIYMNRRFETVDIGTTKTDYYRPLGVRFDTEFNSVKISASYDENEYIAFGAEYALSGNTQVYGAFSYLADINSLYGSVGMNMRIVEHDVRLEYTFYDFGYSSFEAEAAYDFTNNLRGSIYGEMEFFDGFDGANLAALLTYTFSNNIELAAGLRTTVGDGDSTDAFFTAAYRFR